MRDSREDLVLDPGTKMLEVSHGVLSAGCLEILVDFSDL